ncbi:DUF4215 domain-containing protein, partial [Haliangium sp.]
MRQEQYGIVRSSNADTSAIAPRRAARRPGAAASRLWALIGAAASALAAVTLGGCLPEITPVQCADGRWCPAGMVCSITFGQQNVCVLEDGCGNGRLDRGEVCDDGNIIAGDGCSADCRLRESCGNGVIDDGEACDDGNISSGDGCSRDCGSDESCGNGILDLPAGEVCDDGNQVSGDGCSGDCRVRESCGNGYLDPGEACDDGNTMAGDGCSANCESREICGNGIVDVGEACDAGDEDEDGRADMTSTCDADCT